MKYLRCFSLHSSVFFNGERECTGPLVIYHVHNSFTYHAASFCPYDVTSYNRFYHKREKNQVTFTFLYETKYYDILLL